MSEASPKGQGQDAHSIHSHSYESRGIVLARISHQMDEPSLDL